MDLPGSLSNAFALRQALADLAREHKIGLQKGVCGGRLASAKYKEI